MSNEITALIAALHDGSMSLSEVADRFRTHSWPRRPNPEPGNYLDMASAALQDPEPFVPGSFDEVTAAYHRGQLTDDQYDVLAAAMSEAKRKDARHG